MEQSDNKKETPLDSKKKPIIEARKKALIKVMEKTFGNISQSCNELHIGRLTYYRWLEDPDFKAEIDSIDFEETKIDYVESKLLKNISKEKEASIIFFMKTKGKKRGYQEHMDVSIKGRLQSLISEPLTPEEMIAFNKALESDV